ncbi:energy transducer TonB [Pandoraea sp. 64-18]|uniref:energy transducer TonB n=1 Tax=Pandoraea sp. 64-18 TaxID=1895806 RepID=UPI00095DB8F3|nr:energy transducer TonB [Pandoraea sp. 64-18]OJY23489.1 MAG: energy transducer TonB [Pandoraea sp. 64-18]
MNYAQPKPPARRLLGIGVALLVHAVILYALLSGLATRVATIIQAPIETRIIEEIKPPPPPPPPPPVKKIAPPPRPVVQPKAYVPPPEVQVQAAPQPNAIAVQSDKPVATTPVAPPAPPVSKPVAGNVGVVCPNSAQVRAAIRYPREALRDNITGNVLVEFVVGTDGQIKQLRVGRSAAPALDRAAENAVRQFHCVAQGQEVRVQVPFDFQLN